MSPARLLRRAALGLAAGLLAATAHAVPRELQAWCDQISPRVTGLAPARCAQAGLVAGEGRSVRGLALWSRDLQPGPSPTLRVLVLGGIHGDEPASVGVVFDWLERALRAADPSIHWRMVPLVNPDGLLRRPATRVNARGVDLNRNFATPDWARDAHAYWARRTGKDPRRFPGPSALSEPESRWVQAQVEHFRPHLIVSVHAPYGVLDFDGPPPPPEKLGSLHLDQVGIYPGSLGHYAGVVRRLPVITVELRDARRVSDPEVRAMWQDLTGWIDRQREHIARAPGPAPAAHP